MPEATHTHRLQIEFAQTSDPGRDPNKQVNEDSCGYAETRYGHLMVLCDGMGGHYGGQEASRTAITTIFEVFEQAHAQLGPAATLKTAIEEAGRRVYLLGGPVENRTRPGSTVVAMLLHDRGVDVAHVGDSRAYVIRGNQIYPLTRDHSMVQGMIDAGMISEQQAIGHPDANKITRALGMRPEVEVEVRPEPMELFNGDILLQASDGLTDLALGADILSTTQQALAAGSVVHASNVLVQMANERGGHDNITVQIVRIAEVGPKVHTTIPGAPSEGHVDAEPLTTPKMVTLNPSAAAPSAPGAELAPPAPPRETVDMTKPDQAPPVQAANAAPNRPPVAPAAGPPAAAGSPVLPTANDVASPAAAVGLHGTYIMSPAARSAAQVAGQPAGIAAAPAPAGPAPGAPAGPPPMAPAPTHVTLTPTAPPAPVALAPTQITLTPTAPPAPVGPLAPPMLSPTVAEAPRSHPPWGAGVHNSQPIPPAPGSNPHARMGTPNPFPAVNAAPGGLLPYHEGSASALPLPPPVMGVRPGFGGGLPHPHQGAAPMERPYVGPTPAPYTPSATSTTAPGSHLSKGGIVFIIIGLSSVIAVLILVVIWALWLR
jgi:PPM family protein phosphatase